ncbi:MAG TPA: APC family permease [Candidatus Limnocylindrales bacterium]
MEITGHEPQKLRRELNIWEAIGISLALMAPSMAANINPQGTSLQIGRAVPLAFFIATIGVLLVAYGFVRLTQQFHHAGSVYGFVGVTLGPRAGVFSGIALMGTYVFYACVTSMAAGIFGADFLQTLGVIPSGDMPVIWPFALGFVALALAFVFALVPVRDGTRVLLTIEGVTVALILITAVVILVKLLAGGAPSGQTFTLDVFVPTSDTPISNIAIGSVFGFLSFAGFEAAATLGEEAKHPNRDIPRAILGVAVFGGLYFVFVTAIEVMGFGAGADGVKAFQNSGSLLGDLGAQYIAPVIGDIITVGAAISAFGCCLACLVGASRLLFALGRDNRETTGLGWTAVVSERWGTPAGALVGVSVAAAVIIVAWALAFSAKAFDVFVGSGVIGTLILLVAYAFATIGAIKFLFFSGRPRVAMWELIFPILALVVLAATLYWNLSFDPTSTAFGYQIVVIVWLAIGLLFVFGLPGLARRVGERLESDEGLLAARS